MTLSVQFHLLAVGDVKNCELQAARHQCCPGVSGEVGVAVDVQVLPSLIMSVRRKMVIMLILLMAIMRVGMTIIRFSPEDVERAAEKEGNKGLHWTPVPTH